MTEAAAEHLESSGVGVKPYEAVLDDVRALAGAGKRLWVDPAQVSPIESEMWAQTIPYALPLLCLSYTLRRVFAFQHAHTPTLVFDDESTCCAVNCTPSRLALHPQYTRIKVPSMLCPICTQPGSR